MQGKLQRFYQIQKEVSRGSYFQGVIESRDLERLAGKLEGEQDNILVEFAFVDSGFDHPILKGHLETSLSVECQRCLKDMKLSMKIDFKLFIDASDDLALKSSLESIYSNDGYIDIFEVVEEELILGLPLVATHEDKSCNEFWRSQDKLAGVAVNENPFSVLKKLKNN